LNLKFKQFFTVIVTVSSFVCKKVNAKSFFVSHKSHTINYNLNIHLSIQ